MLQAFLFTFVGAYIIALVWNTFRKNDVEMLPSLVWLLLMVLPFLVQLDTFPESRRVIQTFGVTFIGICLMVGDSFRVGPMNQEAAATTETRVWWASYWLYATLFLVMAAFHLSLLPHIPFIEKHVYGIADTRVLSQMREETSKLLAVPALLKYAFTWTVNILAPLAVVLAIRQRHYYWALSFILLAGLYAIMSLATAPLSILATVLIVALVFRCTYRRRLYGYFALTLFCAPIVWNAHNFFISHSLSIFNLKATPEAIAALGLPEDDPRRHLTVGDRARLVPSQVSTLTAMEERYNYYAYRVFLGPVDVSSRWYQFYPAYSEGFVGLQGLSFADQKHAVTHPARRVGKWAYAERFPDKYFETVQAYASVDADAYARFGVVGLIVAGVILVALRLLLKVFRLRSQLSETLYAIGLVLYGLLLPMASVQAILVSNGLIVVLSMMFLIWYRHGRGKGGVIQRCTASGETCA